MLDESELNRVRMARRMAHKLATHKSKKRTIRKLPQTMVIVASPRLKRAYPGREALLRNKRLAYIVLLGAVMCAYMYDLDTSTLESMLKMVSEGSPRHLVDLISNT